MRRGLLTGLAALAAASLSLAACGDDESSPTTADSEGAVLIAETINELRSALEAGDGEAACDLLSEEGRTIVEGAAIQDSCANVVEDVIEGAGKGGLGDLIGSEDYTAEDVVFESGGGGTDTVPTGEPGVEVPCKQTEGTSYFLLEEGGEWRLVLPFCSGE